MSEQTWAIVVGFGTVVGLRLLDWAFPKGYVWRKVQDWSVKQQEDRDERTN